MSDLRLTTEQAQVAHAPLNGLTKVVAYAGTGKTSSLCALAQRNRGMRGLYLAFTKSAEMDARQRFPRSVQCKTVNALAMGVTGKAYLRKLGSLRPIDAIKLMGLAWDWKFAGLVVDTVSAWCASDLEVFPDSAIAVGAMPVAPGHLLKYAAVVAGKLWLRMIDPDDPAPMTHDGYLKLFQLQHPTLPWDYVMLDEAQDTNPVTWDIVRRQKCPVVIVGDGYQSIFQFRGAINAMEKAEATRVLSLTQSFRFGPRVARIANALLWGYFTETTPLEGVGFDTVVRALPRDLPRHAVIARTNAEIFAEAVSAVTAGKSLGFAGGVNSYGFEKIIDAWRLAIGDTDSIRDPYLRDFKDFAALEDYANKSRDLEVRRLLKIVLTYRDQIPDLVDSIHSACHPMLSEADVILSTAHRCKGLTLPVVRLAEDFPVLLDDRGNLLPPDKLDRQEVNLLYVAITRAQNWLMLNSTTLNFLRAMSLGDLAEEHALVADAPGDGESATWENDLPLDDGPEQAVEPARVAPKPPQFSQGDLFDLA